MVNLFFEVNCIQNRLQGRGDPENVSAELNFGNETQEYLCVAAGHRRACSGVFGSGGHRQEGKLAPTPTPRPKSAKLFKLRKIIA